MKALNKETAAKTQRPERIIQFGEGNFLRAFMDWIIYNMNEKTDFNSSVVVVQPIEKGMVDMLNACLLYTSYGVFLCALSISSCSGGSKSSHVMDSSSMSVENANEMCIRDRL